MSYEIAVISWRNHMNFLTKQNSLGVRHFLSVLGRPYEFVGQIHSPKTEEKRTQSTEKER